MIRQLIHAQANLNYTYGACCNEMDLWEANSQAEALTPHPCNATGVKLCTGTACSNDLTVCLTLILLELSLTSSL
jgi:hypothetical protein